MFIQEALMNPIALIVFGLIIAILAYVIRKIIHVPTPFWTITWVFSFIGGIIFLAGLIMVMNPILDKL
jgi:hypothetical protein